MGTDKEITFVIKDVVIILLVIIIAYLIANQLGFNQINRTDRVERFEKYLGMNNYSRFYVKVTDKMTIAQARQIYYSYIDHPVATDNINFIINDICDGQ